MFELSAKKAELQVLSREILTCGAVDVFECKFTFDESWEGLSKTVIFRAGSTQIAVLMDGDTCQIPWETLAAPYQTLWAGICGMDQDTVVLPTIWTELGKISPSARAEGTSPQEPTPDIYQQILSAAENAEEIAQSVRDDADEGKFDGAPGVGMPAVTAADNGKMAQVVDGVWAAVTIVNAEEEQY